MSARKGDWFTTFTGWHFYPLDPRAEEVSIRDIAHALSNICRYGGHCREFYSVAQHSVLVSAQFRTRGTMLLALLHDAAEAYIGDMVRPLKLHQPAFRKVEHNIMATIYKALDVCPPSNIEHEAIKSADNVLLVTEARDLLRDSSWIANFSERPLRQKIEPLSPGAAEVLFLNYYAVEIDNA